jgi:hypothetical protein
VFKEKIQINSCLQNILELQEAVNNYPEDEDIPFPEYIRQTDWYRNFITNENKNSVDKIITLASTSNVPGQPVQCVGFVMMASWFYPELNIPYVGSASVSSAFELIPSHLVNKNDKHITKGYTDYGACVVSGPISLKEYQQGDLFITTDGIILKSTGKPSGHIGLILDKIELPT